MRFFLPKSGVMAGVYIHGFLGAASGKVMPRRWHEKSRNFSYAVDSAQFYDLCRYSLPAGKPSRPGSLAESNLYLCGWRRYFSLLPLLSLLFLSSTILNQVKSFRSLLIAS
jgi:hypothetical protein